MAPQKLTRFALRFLDAIFVSSQDDEKFIYSKKKFNKLHYLHDMCGVDFVFFLLEMTLHWGTQI